MTPALAGYTFAPTSRTYANVGADQPGQDYVATVATGGGIVWVDDAVPAGATATGNGEGWNWISSNPAPYSGTLAHQSALAAGMHQHYFTGATTTLPVGVGNALFAYVYLDPANPPSELMLQWNDGTWEHRAYWGANLIAWGTDGTVSRRYMGPLPATGQWTRLSIPATQVGLGGSTLNGMAYAVYNGRATWDYAGRYLVWVDDALPAGAVPAGTNEGWSWVSTNPTPYSENARPPVRPCVPVSISTTSPVPRPPWRVGSDGHALRVRVPRSCESAKRSHAAVERRNVGPPRLLGCESHPVGHRWNRQSSLHGPAAADGPVGDALGAGGAGGPRREQS